MADEQHEDWALLFSAGILSAFIMATYVFRFGKGGIYTLGGMFAAIMAIALVAYGLLRRLWSGTHMSNSEKTPAYLGLNLGLVGSAFYIHHLGIPIAHLAVAISVTGAIFNVLVWRAENERSGDGSVNAS